MNQSSSMCAYSLFQLLSWTARVVHVNWINARTVDRILGYLCDGWCPDDEGDLHFLSGPLSHVVCYQFSTSLAQLSVTPCSPHKHKGCPCPHACRFAEVHSVGSAVSILLQFINICNVISCAPVKKINNTTSYNLWEENKVLAPNIYVKLMWHGYAWYQKLGSIEFSLYLRDNYLWRN